MKAIMGDGSTGDRAKQSDSRAAATNSERSSALGALAVAASGLVLIWGASQFTFFDDEAFSLRRYILPMGEMVSALYRGVEPDPPLYYLLENLWIRVVGVSSPLLMRIPSIVFFIAGLLVIRPAAAAWYGERVGRMAQVLAALHPAHLLFGMAARWYSLMFLAVAVLLWMTAVAMRGGPGRALRLIGWSLAAAVVCYTNYFGVGVVGLAWIAGVLASRRCSGHALRAGSRGQSRAVLSPVDSEKVVHEQDTFVADRREDRPALIGADRDAGNGAAWMGWLFAGLVVAVLYAPWATAFYRQLTIFPRVGGGINAYASSAGRTVLALTSGNLASPRAWWVHVPLAVFAVLALILVVRQFRQVWPVALIAGGSVLAGILSQTMLDKYVLSLSGPLCVLVAAMLTGSHADTSPARDRRLARIAIACLCIGWLGCGVHLATGRYWSSLRWLDPFDAAATQAVQATMGGGGSIVASHPAAAYYLARTLAGIAHPDGAGPGAAGESRRAYEIVFASLLTPSAGWAPGARGPEVLSPLAGSQALERLPAGTGIPASLRRIVVVESAEFQADTAWAALRTQLAARYSLSDRRSYLQDSDAEFKDRLDPRFKHPKFRIEVLTWDLK